MPGMGLSNLALTENCNRKEPRGDPNHKPRGNNSVFLHARPVTKGTVRVRRRGDKKKKKRE